MLHAVYYYYVSMIDFDKMWFLLEYYHGFCIETKQQQKEKRNNNNNHIMMKLIEPIIICTFVYAWTVVIFPSFVVILMITIEPNSLFCIVVVVSLFKQFAGYFFGFLCSLNWAKNSMCSICSEFQYLCVIMVTQKTKAKNYSNCETKQK